MKTEILSFPGVYFEPKRKSWVACWLQDGLPQSCQCETEEAAFVMATDNHKDWEYTSNYIQKGFTPKEYDLLIQKMQEYFFVFIGGNSRYSQGTLSFKLNQVLNFVYKDKDGDFRTMRKYLSYIKEIFQDAVICVQEGSFHVTIYSKYCDICCDPSGVRFDFCVEPGDTKLSAQEYAKRFPDKVL